MSNRKICLIHDDDWAGQDVEYSVCDDCKAQSENDMDHIYFEGIPVRVIINRPWQDL